LEIDEIFPFNIINKRQERETSKKHETGPFILRADIRLKSIFVDKNMSTEKQDD